MRILMELVSLGSRLFLAGLFIYAAHDKVWDPAGFALDVAKYDLLPLELVNAFSVGLAWLELLVGVFLLMGLMVRAAAFWTSMLLLMFTGLMIYAGFTGAGFDCGCFPGQSTHAAGFDAALRDFFYLLPALWLWCRPGKWLQFYKPIARHDRLW
jgi:putative oxidoreductase